jgi:hypothetical protein
VGGAVVFADATNLMKRLPEGALLSKPASAETVLLQLKRENPLASRIHAVFDGHPFHIASVPKIVMLHFSFDESADAVLLRLMAAKNAGKTGTLISFDRDLQQQANRLGIRPGSFGQQTGYAPLQAEKPVAEDSWREKLLKLRFDS